MTYKQTAIVDIPVCESRRTLIPKIGMSYIEKKGLLEVVNLFNNGKYETGLLVLDKVIESVESPIDPLLLKGEMLALAEENNETIKVYSKVLEIEPNNVFALLGKLIQLNRIKANIHIISAFSDRLRTLSPKVYNNYKKVMLLKENHENNFDRTCFDDQVDALMVFGYFINEDGTFPEKLQKRLTKVIELSNRYPEAQIVISGGPVQNCFSEAKEINRYLVNEGIEENRIFSYEQAKDTVGNIIEFLNFMHKNPVYNVCAVTSKDHLPRAWMSLVTGFEQAGINATVNGEAPEDYIDSEMIEREQNLNYQTLFRLAGLFEKQDIKKLL